jgi:hypothetical protein
MLAASGAGQKYKSLAAAHQPHRDVVVAVEVVGIAGAEVEI